MRCNLSCSNTKETLERRLKKTTEIEVSWAPSGVRGGSLMQAGVVHPTFRVCWNQAHIQVYITTIKLMVYADTRGWKRPSWTGSNLLNSCSNEKIYTLNKKISSTEKYIQENRPLGRPKLRWKDNIMQTLQKQYSWCGLDSTGSEQRPMAGSCEHGREPWLHFDVQYLLQTKRVSWTENSFINADF